MPQRRRFPPWTVEEQIEGSARQYAFTCAVLITAPVRRPDWEILPETIKGSIFLLSLVLCATLMPVERLPSASWQTALGLGFVSAVFDNIPLTALALNRVATTGARSLMPSDLVGR